MFFQIELLYFVLMIAVFIVCVLAFKLPAGISMMISAVIGMALSAIISHTEFSLRELVDGAFGYFDTILIITAAMIFMGGLQASGALDYISALLVKKLYKFPTLLLISFMIIIMFPAMVTGSSLASIISSGALIAPIMIKMGIPKEKAGAIVAFGAVLGMVAPPINVPVMAICDVVDIPYIGFTLPLLILTLPLAIFTCLFLGRKYISHIDLEEMSQVIDFSILDKKPKGNLDTNNEEELNVENKQDRVYYNFTIFIPVIILISLIIVESIWPAIFGRLGMTLIFLIATIPTFFVGKKGKGFKENALNIVNIFKNGVEKSLGAMGLLCGVGMFVQVLTLSGARGWFVANVISLSSVWQYVAMGLSLPIFGGISAFGSASILGGPFVMAFLRFKDIVVASGLSLLAALGEFLPPTAMSATFCAEIVGEKKYINITKAAAIPLATCLAYTLVYIFALGYLAKLKGWF